MTHFSAYKVGHFLQTVIIHIDGRKENRRSSNRITNRQQRRKMKYIKKTLVFTLTFLIISCKAKELNDEHPDGLYSKNLSLRSHRRVRRMLGRKTKCFPKLVKFCHRFTYGATTKKFCLMVNVKKCTALD